MFMICGDFNSRCSVDYIPQRNIIDYTLNSHGQLFVDFLLSANCCIVNRRGTSEDVTSVSTKSLAVVDYYVVPQNICQRWVISQ